MTLLLNKPKPITLLNRTDPLLKGLVCAAALNEPGGVSRNLVRSGLLAGTPAAGGLATNIASSHEPWFNSFGSGYTFCLWHSGITLGSWGAVISVGDSTLSWQRYSSSSYFKNYHNGNGQTMSNFLLSEIANPGMLVCLWNGSEMQAYVDGVQVGNASMATAPKTNSTTSTLTIGGSCTVYQILAYDRALSESEIQRLYRAPLALFRQASLWPPAVLAGGATHGLAGSIGAATQLSTTVKATRRVSGSIDAAGSPASTLRNGRAISGSCIAQANLTASLTETGTVTLAAAMCATSSSSAVLTIVPAEPQTMLPSEMDWLGEALFNGATASAFKLGTVLSGGWFWMRQAGCSAVYRGPSITQVDFNNILCVADRDAQEIVLPAYLSHEPNARYCYVVRRFNACGYSERTAAAAVMVRLGDNGKLREPVPNSVFGLNASPVTGHRVRLVWSYCPLDQQTEPEVFCIYTDNGAGQIDFEPPIATVPYKGRKFYRYLTGALPDGLYRFVVRAGSEDPVDSMSLSSLSFPVQSHCLEGVAVLAAEVIP